MLRCAVDRIVVGITGRIRNPDFRKRKGGKRKMLGGERDKESLEMKIWGRGILLLGRIEVSTVVSS